MNENSFSSCLSNKGEVNVKGSDQKRETVVFSRRRKHHGEQSQEAKESKDLLHSSPVSSPTKTLHTCISTPEEREEHCESSQFKEIRKKCILVTKQTDLGKIDTVKRGNEHEEREDQTCCESVKETPETTEMDPVMERSFVTQKAVLYDGDLDPWDNDSHQGSLELNFTRNKGSEEDSPSNGSEVPEDLCQWLGNNSRKGRNTSYLNSEDIQMGEKGDVPNSELSIQREDGLYDFCRHNVSSASRPGSADDHEEREDGFVATRGKRKLLISSEESSEEDLVHEQGTKEVSPSGSCYDVDTSDCEEGVMNKTYYSSSKSVGYGDLGTDNHNSTCERCGHEGDLICCDGRGCKATYHLFCLDPPLSEVPIGDWFCPECEGIMDSVRVNAHLKGIESIWDVKEASSIVDKGSHEEKGPLQTTSESNMEQHPTLKQSKLDKEKLYFVKFKQLSHIHNQWIPESQLVKMAPKLLNNFKKRMDMGKVLKWNPDWVEPCRIIGRWALNDGDSVLEGSGNIIDKCLIKWKGLGYDHCTLESIDGSFLSCPTIKDLIKGFEERCLAANQRAQPNMAEKENSLRLGDYTKLIEQPHWIKGGDLNSHQMDILNAIRKCWKSQENGIIVDDSIQERNIIAIAFMVTLLKEFKVVKPILVVTSSAMLEIWEVLLIQWSSNANMVTYSGTKDARDIIQRYEILNDQGYVMVDILLTSFDLLNLDSDYLKEIQWEALVVDECQRLKSAKTMRSLHQMTCNFRLLLFSEGLKNNPEDYLQFLSLLEGDIQMLESELPKQSKASKDGDLWSDLKKRFMKHMIYENNQNIGAQFEEFWVPVEMTEIQIEEYCKLLIENSNLLTTFCNNRKETHSFSQLIIKLRECCNHPFIVNPGRQASLVGLSPRELLDQGIKASGKLQLLDSLLLQAKLEGRKMVVITQANIRIGKISSMDYLDDYVRQQFGIKSYERIDTGLITSMRHVAVQRFNEKNSECFVFLIDKRAFGPSIKLPASSSIVIYDSDWNPQSDIQTLQRVVFDCQQKCTRVCRLYTAGTVEERVLIFARRNAELDLGWKNVNLLICQKLLRWGVRDNFKLFDSLSERDNSARISSKIVYNKDDLKCILGKKHEDINITGISANSCLLTAFNLREAGKYSQSLNLYMETDVNMREEVEVPSMQFWSNVLKDRQGELPEGRGLRTRKKVQYCEDSLARISETEGHRNEEDEGIRRKRRKVIENFDNFLNAEQEHWGQTTSRTSSEHQNDSEETSRKLMDKAIPSVGATASRNNPIKQSENQVLFLLMKCDLLLLCKALKFQGDITKAAEQLLVFFLNKFKLPRENKSLLHAVELAICWMAAEENHYSIDRSTTLGLAESCFNMQLGISLVTRTYAGMVKKRNGLCHIEEGRAEVRMLNRTPSQAHGKSHMNYQKVASANSLAKSSTAIAQEKQLSSNHLKVLLGQHKIELEKFDEAKKRISSRVEKDFLMKRSQIFLSAFNDPSRDALLEKQRIDHQKVIGSLEGLFESRRRMLIAKQCKEIDETRRISTSQPTKESGNSLPNPREKEQVTQLQLGRGLHSYKGAIISGTSPPFVPDIVATRDSQEARGAPETLRNQKRGLEGAPQQGLNQIQPSLLHKDVRVSTNMVINSNASASSSHQPSTPPLSLFPRTLPFTTSSSGISIASTIPATHLANASLRSTQHHLNDPLFQESLRAKNERDKMISLHEAERERIKSKFIKDYEELKQKYNSMLEKVEDAYTQGAETLELNLTKVQNNHRLAEQFKATYESPGIANSATNGTPVSTTTLMKALLGLARESSDCTVLATHR